MRHLIYYFFGTKVKMKDMRVISNAIIVLELSLEVLMSLQIMKKTTALRFSSLLKKITRAHLLSC
jgi:hypothetical protein